MIWETKFKLKAIKFTGNNIKEIKDFTVNPIMETTNQTGESMILIKDGMGDGSEYTVLNIGDYLSRLSDSHRDGYLTIMDGNLFETLYKKVED